MNKRRVVEAGMGERLSRTMVGKASDEGRGMSGEFPWDLATDDEDRRSHFVLLSHC